MNQFQKRRSQLWQLFGDAKGLFFIDYSEKGKSTTGDESAS